MNLCMIHATKPTIMADPALKRGKPSLEAPGKLKKKNLIKQGPRIQKREAHKPQFKKNFEIKIKKKEKPSFQFHFFLYVS